MISLKTENATSLTVYHSLIFKILRYFVEIPKDPWSFQSENPEHNRVLAGEKGYNKWEKYLSFGRFEVKYQLFPLYP